MPLLLEYVSFALPFPHEQLTKALGRQTYPVAAYVELTARYRLIGYSLSETENPVT
jgi:hypothetical protein